MSEQKPTDPLAAYKERQRLDRHVEQAIRERADIAYVLDEDGGPSLRPGGEFSIWRAVERAMAEIGWGVRRVEH